MQESNDIHCKLATFSACPEEFSRVIYACTFLFCSENIIFHVVIVLLVDNVVTTCDRFIGTFHIQGATLAPFGSNSFDKNNLCFS